MEIQDLLEIYSSKVLALDQVIGIGRGFKEVGGQRTENEAIHVLVKKKLPKKELRRKDLVPEFFDGVPTDVIQIGVIKALGIRTEKVRPALPGTSIAHYQVTAGTFGALVYDKTSGKPLILSNNHILANGNTEGGQYAKIGDPVLQPGPYDGGTIENDLIGRLVRYVPLRVKNGQNPADSEQKLPHLIIDFMSFIIYGPKALVRTHKNSHAGQENIVDAAVALPLSSDLITDDIIDIGTVAGVRNPELGELLAKSGRTSGFTSGSVRTLNATVNVEMDRDEEAIFKEQIIVDLHSEGGDSGSLVVDRKRNACGLLFAGSDTVTICNPIQAVLDALNITFERQ